MSALRIGVIVDEPAQVPTLRQAVLTAGQEMAVALEFARTAGRVADADVDAWIINLDVEALEATHPEPLDALLDSIDVPMILCEGHIPNHVSPEFANWQRRLGDKLHGLAGQINRTRRDAPRHPRYVWVLAGSIGGPDAVKQFLDAVPPKLGVAFVYANHIERDYQGLLTQVMGRNSHYEAYAPRHGDLLRENAVAVVSPEHITTVSRDGSFNVHKAGWVGQYKPNLDQVVASTAMHFGRQGGVIVFSGMCDDAAAASRLMRRCGGQVWTQERSSCVNWAMPEATEQAVGKPDFSGDPAALAARLTAWVQASNSHAKQKHHQ